MSAMEPVWEPCGQGCACNRLTMVCWGPIDRADGIISDLDAARMALEPAGTCDGCGSDAVELATWLEDDGGPRGVRLSYCRPCMGDDAGDPSLEWITGEAV